MDTALIDLESDIEIDNKKLTHKLTDIRTEGLTTTKELDLFLFSSNYQTIKGGMADFSSITGIEVDTNPEDNY